MTEPKKTRAKKDKPAADKAAAAPAPEVPQTKEQAAIAAAKAGPEPETLRQATQTFLDKVGYMCNKGAPGDVHAIRQELERFIALDHGIMREYCVPLHPEVEKHFKALRKSK